MKGFKHSWRWWFKNYWKSFRTKKR